MPKLNSSVEFVNHASVLVSYKGISILSDPWYSGDAFHKGWNLLHETRDNEVFELLKRVSHIWISHEHPDHFSIAFFKKFSAVIKKNGIEILFQETKDKRVVKYLQFQELSFSELKFNEILHLSKNTSVICLKDGFYDSGLLISNDSEKILNLNDCEVKTTERVKEVKQITGEVDLLLTQFSYAAWKGGEKNKAWRKEAAQEKLSTMKLQIEGFKPSFVIPFASFIYFSNEQNRYLNDAVNTFDDIESAISGVETQICFMQPNDVLGGTGQTLDEQAAKIFWKQRYDQITQKEPNSFQSISEHELKDAFYEYSARILKKNSRRLMNVIRWFSPISAFKPVVIYLHDTQLYVHFDYLKCEIRFEHDGNAMLSMHSESLFFMFKNTFGFDTLTVNGCFEEEKPNGFTTATKSLAVENLNNLGIYINLKTLLNFSVIKMFIVRLYRVAKKLE